MTSPSRKSLIDPFDVSTHLTERSVAAKFMHWMAQIIEKEDLDLGTPDVETGAQDRKFPDIVIYMSRRSNRALCVIEAKPPAWNVLSQEGLKQPAWEKAVQRKAPYFAVTNFRTIIWYDTEKANAQAPEEEQIIAKYTLSNLGVLEEIRETRFQDSIKSGLTKFLVKLFKVYTKKEPQPKIAIDELLIFRLHEKIKVLSRYYKSVIYDRYHKRPDFALQLKKWFAEQNWSFVAQGQDFEKAARQTAYLLVNKILFYNLLQAKRPEQLEPLTIPEGLFKGKTLQTTLQMYFIQVLDIDYETIYTTDFIDTIAFPQVKEVIEEIKELTAVLGRYDFSTLGYDIVGGIFERLIPHDERHALGQYFTSADVVDLILSLCLRHEEDIVIDPSCGAGTFLVRAYQHKKMMNQSLEHEAILDSLWGVDIAKFPAHLATINLAINDLGVEKNYPCIIQKDFFALKALPDGGVDLPENWRKQRAHSLGIEEKELILPRLFDAIVGNPPYTRQEEIPDIGVNKNELIENALKALNGDTLATINKRAGIHAYFFVHGTKFLKEGGRFGFIVSESWLDTDYGKGLQEFFLKNYKVVAIIGSKVERWFTDAAVNTCIVILEKCADKDQRDENLVRYDNLKKPLRDLLPPAQDIWEKQNERRETLTKVRRTILGHDECYENNDMRILPKHQHELWSEGFNSEDDEYAGAKWGKYLRAPDVFFRIMEKNKDNFVPLEDLGETRRGYTTGANEFFYVTPEFIKEKKIEKEFWMHEDEKGNLVPNHIIKSPRDCRGVIVKPDKLKVVLMIHKDRKELARKNILRYIKEGEKQGFDKRSTCAARKRWYELNERAPGTILWEMIHFERLKAPYNKHKVYVDHNLFEIFPKNPDDELVIAAQLNCTFFAIVRELWGRVGLGEGSIKTEGVDIARFPLVKPEKMLPGTKKRIEKAFLAYVEREKVESILAELGAESRSNVSLGSVKPDRRELDKAVMAGLLGLNDEEQLEVYRAVVDLVASRLGKAKSVEKRSRAKEGIDIDMLVKTVLQDIGSQSPGAFYKEKILSQESLIARKLPETRGEGRIEEGLLGWDLCFEKSTVECRSGVEARYLNIFAGTGIREVKTPKKDEDIIDSLPEFERLKARARNKIDEHAAYIVNARLREQVVNRIWTEIWE